MDGWKSFKETAASAWKTRTGPLGWVFLAFGLLLTIAGWMSKVENLADLWSIIQSWLPLLFFALAIWAFLHAGVDAKKNADARAAETQATIDSLLKRFDEQASSLREKMKENHRRELEELARWSELSTQVSEIARRYRLIAAVKDHRETVRRALETYVRMLASGAQENARRGRPHEHSFLESSVRSLAAAASYLDPQRKYPIGAQPLDTDINAAQAPHEDQIPQHELTRWRTLWLRAERALTQADQLTAETDAETMRMEVNLTQRVATKTAV